MKLSYDYLEKNGYEFDFDEEGYFEHDGDYLQKSEDTIILRGKLSSVPGELAIVFPHPIVDVEQSLEGEWEDYEFCPD